MVWHQVRVDSQHIMHSYGKIWQRWTWKSDNELRIFSRFDTSLNTNNFEFAGW